MAEVDPRPTEASKADEAHQNQLLTSVCWRCLPRCAHRSLGSCGHLNGNELRRDAEQQLHFLELDAGQQTFHVALHKMSDEVLTNIANDQIIRS